MPVLAVNVIFQFLVFVLETYLSGSHGNQTLLEVNCS